MLNNLKFNFHSVGKYEVPFTVREAESIFELKSNRLHRELVSSVYLPAYPTDAGSGRNFSYGYSRTDYLAMIKRLSTILEVVLTYPYGSPEVVGDYIENGVKTVMVSQWSEGWQQVRQQYKISIERSIVGNALTMP